MRKTIIFLIILCLAIVIGLSLTSCRIVYPKVYVRENYQPWGITWKSQIQDSDANVYDMYLTAYEKDKSVELKIHKATAPENTYDTFKGTWETAAVISERYTLDQMRAADNAEDKSLLKHEPQMWIEICGGGGMIPEGEMYYDIQTYNWTFTEKTGNNCPWEAESFNGRYMFNYTGKCNLIEDNDNYALYYPTLDTVLYLTRGYNYNAGKLTYYEWKATSLNF